MIEYGVIYRQPDGVIYRRYHEGNLSSRVEYVHLAEDLPEDHYSNNLEISEILFVQRVRSSDNHGPDTLSILDKYELALKEEVECIDEVPAFEMMVSDTARRIEEETSLGFGRTYH